MKEFEIEGSVVTLVPVIHGLVEEAKKVEEAYNKVRPDCIAVGIAKEDIEAIKNYDNKMDMPVQYEYYLLFLSNYGKVALPPPDIKKAYDIAKLHGTELHPIDVDDDEYADLLIKHASIIALIRQSRKLKKLNKKTFTAKNAEEFVIEWDRYMNSIKAFRKIEEARERKMAENLNKLAKKFKKILAIVPMERYNGVLASLERYKK